MAKSVSEKVRNYIPDDLAFSILSKLPLKSLKRFGCVRKTWSVLFENPNFMIKFSTNFISIPHSYYNDTSLLLHQIVYNPNHYVCFSLHSLSGERFENRVKLEFPNPFHEEDPGFSVLDSGGITGILCLHNSDSIVLWNPTTDEFKVIPPSPVESDVPPYLAIVKILYGFGYDPFSDDYKIIRDVGFVPLTDDDIPSDVSERSYDEDPYWEVYSLRCNSWRRIDLVLPACCYNNFNNKLLYMDGVCHWLSISRDNDDNMDYLVSFDLTNEIFSTTLIPFDMDPNECNLRQRELVLLNGYIASITWIYCLDMDPTFHISILGELGLKESWTKLFIVGPLPCIKYPIGVGKNGDIFFVKKDNEPIYFDLCTQMIEELGSAKGTHYSKIILYKESLISIGGINN